jgi:hypothetical protein
MVDRCLYFSDHISFLLKHIIHFKRRRTNKPWALRVNIFQTDELEFICYAINLGFSFKKLIRDCLGTGTFCK